MHRTLATTSGALLGLGVLLAGCGSQGTSPTTTSASRSGGTAVIALAPSYNPNWFFPMLSAAAFSNVNSQIDSMMYRPLIIFTVKDAVDYSRSLVSAITPNANGTKYTLTLSHKYKWSNGRPITAKDVVFTWNVTKAASENGAPWVYGGAGIGGLPTRWSSVTADGSDKVVVTLNKPSNPTWFIHNGLGQLWPVPARVWDRYPGNMNQELNFIKSVANSPMNGVYKVVDGAYHIQSATPNNQWVFVPNKSFAGHKSSLAKVIFQYETSDSSEFTALKTGTVNVGYLPPADWNARSHLTNDVITTPYLLGFNYLILNLNPKAPGGLGPVFQQLYVRQAIQMGVDQPKMISAIFNGNATQEGGPVAPLPKTPFSNPAVAKPLYPYNPQQGKALLEKHGWHEVNGVMENHGKKLEFTFLAISNDAAQTAKQQMLQHDWAQEGIKVTIRQAPFDNIISEATQQNPTKWSMADWGAGWTYEPDYFPSGGGLFATGAASNFEGYSNRTEDALISKVYEPGTAAQTLQRLYAYEKYTAQQVPVIFLPWASNGYAQDGYAVHAKNIHGTVKTFNPITNMIFPNYWTVSQ